MRTSSAISPYASMSMRPDPRLCCASARIAIATIADRVDRVGIGRIAAIGETAATGEVALRAARVKTQSQGAQPSRQLAPPPLFPSSQVVPVFGRQRAEDRLQGHAPVVALHLRTWQDRAVADHRGERRQAARTRPGDQALPISGPLALCDPLTTAGRRRA